jgi:predicted oxidoreductase
MTPNGPEFSQIAVGFWRLHEWDFNTKDVIHFIENALEQGITTFDHADIYGDYGNEEIFGRALKKRPDLRDKMELVTKCGICLTTENRPNHHVQHYNTTADHIRHSVERSLRKLNTDVLDLILIHRPDPLMNGEEMAGIFMKLIEEGKIKHVGVSNFTVHQAAMFQSKLDVPLATNQVECSLLHPNPLYDGVFDQAQKWNSSPMIWSPFAGGRIFSESNDQANRVRSLLSELSEKYNSTPGQIALAWILSFPCKPQPVLGTGKTKRVTEAAKALSINLEKQDWFRLLEASNGHPVP